MALPGMFPPFAMPTTFGQVPVGSVIAYAGAVSTRDEVQAHTAHLEASGWLVCDGRMLMVHLYPELFAVLGYLYGGQGDQFGIPDYRAGSAPGTGTSGVNALKGASYIIKYSYGPVAPMR
ncbi:hypothetical protein UNDYM_4196 [Undibacterium sp. YM2]|jgi:hypothetical protein|uniref:phage tail protein n=1 Tax=Undibacterium sp. YM2 TaxID=2058625 RepID=UPI001331D49E|nr:phage tail protein [Undibacterium sp. YM2]BBB68449.1 hypothetical protein UNDYM_4196 [Undibacterium sp. YM2]